MTARYHNPRQTGVTLIELMIGMVLGLFIVGGVIGIFVANQQSAAEKRQLDNTQEAFRYSAHTISRVLRNTIQIEDASTDDSLEITVQRDADTPDCLGNTTPGTVTNRFYFDLEEVDGEEVGVLRCENDSNDEILTEGFNLDNTGFEYGSVNASGWVGESDYEPAASVADWDDVVSVRVNMRTEPGLSSVFTATSRALILASAGHGTGGNGGGNNGGGEPEP
ncbi:MAG: PilW family protein, partial [Halothiobacillaceae bacterium]